MQNLFRVKNARSKKVIQNILASFFIKGWSGVMQLLLVPLTLACLSNYEYGVWMTISTMLVWIESMDIGLGNGMRNMLATYRAEGYDEKAKQVVSTCFYSLALFMLFVGIILYVIEHYINFYAFLNVDANVVNNLSLVIQLSTIIVCATFVFKFIGNVYLALQLPAINNLLLVFGNTLSFVGIFVAKMLFEEVSLIAIAIISTLGPLLVFIISYPITFIKKYPELRPSIKCFKRDMLGDIFVLGLKFFVLQMASLVLFSTSNIIISRYIGPSSVAPYQVTQRYFNLVLVLFTIIVVPLWSATTDAYARKDYYWIQSCGKKGLQIVSVILVVLMVMSVVAPYVYSIWTMGKIFVPKSLIWGMASYMLVTVFSLFYAHLLFGMGKVYVQMWVTLAEAIVFIPLAICGANFWGVEGVLYALILVNMGCAVTNFYQFHLLSKGKARGIWNK